MFLCSQMRQYRPSQVLWNMLKTVEEIGDWLADRGFSLRGFLAIPDAETWDNPMLHSVRQWNHGSLDAAMGFARLPMS